MLVESHLSRGSLCDYGRFQLYRHLSVEAPVVSLVSTAESGPQQQQSEQQERTSAATSSHRTTALPPGAGLRDR